MDALNNLPSKRILVVGDVMLDIYKVATATRISPEAPVPVLLNPQTEYRLGGAGAVAAMCRALGAQVDLVACVGLDRAGERVRNIVEATGIGCKLFSLPAPRPTTTKERICGVASGRHRQQLARVDTECTDAIPNEVAVAMGQLISDQKPDAIIIADYAKGVCVDKIIQSCNAKFPIFVDPPKGFDWTRFYGVACIIPNREEATGRTARDLRRQLHTQAVIVKLDEDGCELSYYPHHVQRFPARTRDVHDVTGAGDQFIAALVCARAVGLDWLPSTHLANAAAGLQVERHGCVPVTLDELMTEIHHAPAHSRDAGHRDRTGEAVAAGRP